MYISTRRGSYVIQRAADYGQPFDQLEIKRWVQMLPWSLMRPFYFHKINRKYKHSNYGLAPNFRYSWTATLIAVVVIVVVTFPIHYSFFSCSSLHAIRILIIVINLHLFLL